MLFSGASFNAPEESCDLFIEQEVVNITTKIRNIRN